MKPVETEFARALELHRLGRLEEAEQAYRALLARRGEYADAEHMLGLILHAQKRSAEALPWFERAGARRSSPKLWVNHAAALLALGKAVEAAELCGRAIAAEPAHFGAWLNLGMAEEILGNRAEATAALETALRIVPDQPAALRALARSQLRGGAPQAALQTLLKFVVGTDPEADLIRCEAWIESGDEGSATATLADLVSIDPVRARALILQARIAMRRSNEEARALFEQALALDPENEEANARFAFLSIGAGELEFGLDKLRRWIAVHPDDWNAANVYLFACMNSPRIDAAASLAEHLRLRPMPALAPAWPARWRQRPGKLRIGWLSAQYAGGLLRTFFQNVYREMAARNDEVEHVFYALRDPAGNTAVDAAWGRECQYVGNLGDSRLVERIRADGLDVLVDMVGRAKGNRLAALAARVAPVQVAWFDAINPSGIEAMDYLITDPRLSPPGAEVYFSEKLLRLPYGRLAYNPPIAPLLETGEVGSKTFVSFNRFAKLNDEVVEVWAAILCELPDWNLLLKADGGGDASLVAALHARFGQHAIEPERIVIDGYGAYGEMMEVYANSAIALDPFPFSGCATTCDALWMGLPVVTLPGDTLASRQTASLLAVLGKDAWIAQDADSYVSKTVALACDEAARRDWRRQARDRVVPALCDARRLGEELLQALRAVAQR